MTLSMFGASDVYYKWTLAKSLADIKHGEMEVNSCSMQCSVAETGHEGHTSIIKGSALKGNPSKRFPDINIWLTPLENGKRIKFAMWIEEHKQPFWQITQETGTSAETIYPLIGVAIVTSTKEQNESHQINCTPDGAKPLTGAVPFVVMPQPDSASFLWTIYEKSSTLGSNGQTIITVGKKVFAGTVVECHAWLSLVKEGYYTPTK
jgi:hypothetical protein